MNEKLSESRKRIIRRQYSATGSKTTEEQSYQSDSTSKNSHRRKGDSLICSVCEAPAHGYNFDAITCESCKAFFRRNALKGKEKFKCRGNDGLCKVDMKTRKRCKSCRLDKCFLKGMRADWILTDEERINKRLKIEANRRLRKLIYPESSDSGDEDEDEKETEKEKEKPNQNENENQRTTVSTAAAALTDEDVKRIEQLQRAFEDSIRLTSLPADFPAYPHTAKVEATWEILNVPTNLLASRVITFCKLTPEFSGLNENDKLILVKYNTFAMIFIRSAMNYNRINDTYHEKGTEDCIFQGKDMISAFSSEQYVNSTRCVCRLIDHSRNDALILRIWILIILFSKGAFMCRFVETAEPIARDILSIFRAQNRFVELLWKYCCDRYGLSQAISIWVNFVTAAMEAHLQSFNTMHSYIKNDAVADNLVPLMKSVTLIT